MLIIVPARVGSKGLPGKNSRDFCGHALIDWSLSAALYLQEKIGGASVQVTTDCPMILALVARKYGNKITARKRPAVLSSDTAAMADVVLDAADFSGMGRVGRYVLLQPTSPLRLLSDLENFAKHATMMGAQVSCTRPVEDPHDLIDITNGKPLVAAQPAARRQDHSSYLRFVDGSLYAGDLTQLAKTRSFMPTQKPAFVPLDIPRAIDIDTALDWHMGLALYDWLIKKEVPFVRPAP